MTRHSPFVISTFAALAAACSRGSKTPTSHPTLTSVLPAITCTDQAALTLGGTDFQAGASATLDAVAARTPGGTLSGACIYVAGGATATAPLTLTPSTEYFLW
jgi:hypothetical protein